MSDLPARLTDALAGRYEIERKLGEGGMASVYLALDLKHDRKVALKVLRPELAAVLGAERFLAEIKTTANLQHPHILPLFDSGEADSFLYYVMPYIEGETLRQRLDREQQLGVEEAVRIARDVADALDYAHRHDIVHRDIKPANILLHEGRPMVADFGIALAISAAGGGRMTETGLSLGTPHYMSPEQASADRDLTARSDVYSLGCVLYETLAGQPPHTGPSAQSILVRILTEDPRPLTELRRTVPPNVAATVAKAIEKLPADRFETARHFVEALEDPSFAYEPAEGAVAAVRAASTVPAGRTERGFSRLLPWVVASALAAVAVWGWLRPGPAARVRRLEMILDSPSAPFAPPVALSPDGRRVVYRQLGGGLMVRDLQSLESRAIPGTVGALGPFLSPDGLRVGYRSGPVDAGSLNTVDLGGGPPVELASGSVYPGGVWSDDGYLYYASGLEVLVLMRVPAEGGIPDTVAVPPGEGDLAWPEALPGGRTILAQNDGGLASVDVATGEVTLILREFTGSQLPAMARYAGGYLFWVNVGGTLMAAPFDPRELVLTGAPVSLVSGVVWTGGGSAAFDVADDGTLIYAMLGRNGAEVPAGENMGWVDRSGQVTILDARLAVDANDFDYLSVGPNPRYIAAMVQKGEDQAVDVEWQVWIYDTDQKTFVRLTLEGAHNMAPRWLDDRTVAYLSDRSTGSYGIYAQPFDGSGPERTLFETDRRIESFDVSPGDGSLAVSLEGGTEASQDIVRVAPGSGAGPTPLVATRFREEGPAISRDGRWMAYTSDESGRPEVYVRAYPSGDLRAAISTDGGGGARWSKNGDELFYVGQDGTMMVASLDIDSVVRVRERTRLFPIQPFEVDTGMASWDVAPTGDRLLLIVEAGGTVQESHYVVVLNVFEELRARGGP